MAITIQDVRKIEFGKSYLWEVMFDDNGIAPSLPSNFKYWIPAISVDENVSSVDSHSIDVYNTSFKFPISTSPASINVTFIDDIDRSMEGWLSYWQNTTILNSGASGALHVSTVGECTKILHVRKLNNRRQIVKNTSYVVYPEGSINFTGDSESNASQIQVTFVSVGTIQPDRK